MLYRFIFAGLLLLGFAVGQTDAPVTGCWEGESICTIRDSPCHDEHVIYEISAKDGQANAFAIAAYKVVQGEKQFMGTIDCQKRGAGVLSCTAHTPRHDEWKYQFDARSMTGTLTLDDGKTLYRNIRLKRVL